MEKKRMDKSSLIVLIVVAVLVIGVIGYAVYQQMVPASPNDSVTPTQLSSVAAVSSQESVVSVPTAPSAVSSVPSVPSSVPSVVSQTPSAASTAPANTFTTPSSVKTWFGKSLVDIYGYIPTEDGYYNGGQMFHPDGCPFSLIYSPGEYEAPVMLVSDLSLLVPGKSECTYTELKAALGSKLSALEVSEAFGDYVCEMKDGGYSYRFESTTTTFHLVYITES